MPELPDEPLEVDPEPSEPRLLAAWLTVRQAELMLRHFIEDPMQWPENALYCHGCVTALRAVTNVLQKALRHDAGFADWYEGPDGVQARLKADAELRYIVAARNYVLKQGALELMWSGRITMDGDSPPGLLVHGMREDGPVVSLPDPDADDGRRYVPWEQVPGLHFHRTIRIRPTPDLPPPPERDLREVLADKVKLMHELVADAEHRFDPGAIAPDG